MTLDSSRVDITGRVRARSGAPRGELELHLDGCNRRSKELLERIHAVDLKGHDGFRARRPEIESEDAYRFRHRYWLYRSMLAARWPELARASEAPP